MADDKERFRRALDFMKMLGVSQSLVSPILKRLVKLYDNEWGLIEEENYRALADSFFDQVESKEAKASARVTRNSSRRSESIEKLASEVPAEESFSLHKKTTRRVTFSPVPATSAGNSNDHINGGKNHTEVEDNLSRAASVRQDIACSFSHELQLECVSYKETVTNDLAQSERVHLKKPRVDAAASPSIMRKPDSVVPMATPSPLKVKEEPLELPIVIHRRDDALQPLPPAIMSTRQHEKQLVVFSKDVARRNSELEDSPVREKPRRKLPLLAHIEKSEGKQQNESLMSIAATYGNMSDDESGVSGKNSSGISEKTSSMPLAQSSSHARKACCTGAEGKSGVSCSDLTVKGTETSLKAAVTVKEEPACTVSDGRSTIYTLDHEDISGGQESVPIPVLNSLTTESLPLPFYYIKNNITFQDAYVNFALARIGDDDCCAKCYGNCLESYPPCHCARETGGEFAYDKEGRLRQSLLREAIADKRNAESSSARNKYCEKGSCHLNSEHCKGHLIRKFVKECWSKCGCNMRCGNRVVQKGIRRKLQVAYLSKGKGWGLRTLEDMPPGTFVCEYVGEILTNAELDTRNTARNGHTDHYPALLDADLNSETMLRDEELLCLDATNYGNVARFINHQCYDANLVDIPVEIESPDHHYYHIAFFTTRLVKAFEELTWDYSVDFEDEMHPIKAFRCFCDSQYCRGRHYKA